MYEITENEYQQLRTFIKQKLGINLNNDKKSMICSRLRSTLQENGFQTFTEYYNFLSNDKSGDAIKRFYNKVTTNHTFFMRENDHFEYLQNTVLPYIEQTYSSVHDLRMWCAGCSSGEEAYTLQIIAHEHFKKAKDTWDTNILATDISTTMLDKALAGIYPTEGVNELPADWRKSYFKKYDETNSMVTDEIKKKIIFRIFNFMDDKFPFKKKFQIIFCRNVMIYFDAETKDKLVEKFYDITEPGGYLFIGHSESLNHTATKYKYIMPAVYRKAI